MRLTTCYRSDNSVNQSGVSNRRTTPFGNWAAGILLVLASCGGRDGAQESDLNSVEKAASGYNGGGWNGGGWNGGGWNGGGWNGGGWNGGGWNGLGWNGGGWNGGGWNGGGWNGNAWGGIGSAQDCTISPNNNNCTTLHDWVNHSDVDNNGIAGDEYDRRTRVQALAYWVSCACPASVEIPFSDTHGLFSTALYGQFGLAPIWCGSDSNASVPTSEMEIVSACLMARINMKGKHVPLSLQSLEPGTALSTNERITHGTPMSRFWGNLWRFPHADTDSTTPASNDAANSGGAWWNMERFSCTEPSVYGEDRQDQAVFGRTCDIESCDGQLEHVGYCSEGRKRLGDSGTWDQDNPRSTLYKAVSALRDDPVVAGGHGATMLAGSGGGTNLATSEYRGRSWRVMSVSRPYTISIENPLSTYPSNGASWVKRAWAQVESGTLFASQSSQCLLGTAECQGSNDNGQKLINLTTGQQISLNLSGNLAAPDTSLPGDPNEPMTVAIRYSRAGLLGPGQCDPDMDCASTPAIECSSGQKDENGCLGGVAFPGLLRIWVNNNKPMTSGWTSVHGAGSPYGKNIFPTTYQTNKYSTAYIYPVYMQDSIASIPGAIDHTAGVTYDTMRVRIQGEHPDPSFSPHLDTAYFLPGSPPSDADCKGIGGCWLYAGPSESVLLTQNQEWHHTTPILPPGSYTFQITGLTNDADLYVKKNGTVSTTNWDCRPYSGSGVSETCNVTLTGRGGYLSVMVRGYSTTSAATLLGKN